MLVEPFKGEAIVYMPHSDFDGHWYCLLNQDSLTPANKACSCSLGYL